MSELSDLVDGAVSGEEEAFTELVRLHERAVFSLAFQRCMNYSEAEDIAQDVFLRAYRDLQKLRHRALFGKWLYGIALNVIRERTRGRKPEVPLDSVPEPAAAGTDHQEQDSKRLLFLVSQLPEKYRIPLTLHYVDNLKYARIAEMLDMPEVTARSLVHRGKTMLAKKMFR